MWAFGPHTRFLTEYNVREYMPIRWDGIMEETRSILAPDLMASCCLYLLLSVYSQRAIIVLFSAFDLPYYGPLGLAMPMTLLIYYKVIRKVK